MLLSKRSALLAVIGLSWLTMITAQRLQIIRFFQSMNCVPQQSGTNPYFEYTQSTNISNEPTQLMSYCVVRGAWRVELALVSSKFDYNITDGDGCLKCISKGNNNNRKFAVIKQLGGADLAHASISLFKEADFDGREYHVNGWEFSYDETLSIASVAFSSFSNWTWQAYSLPRFRGTSTCFRPNLNSEVTTINPTTANIGSIRLGCRNAANKLQFREIGIISVVIAFVIPIISGSS